MPVDLYGLPADYLTIGDVASRHGLLMLADAAQSFGGSTGNRRVGALAPITATSFYPTKPLGCYGDGGAILTNDARLAESVRQIRSHGRQGDGDVALQLGLTGRLETIQAAILLVKLEVFEVDGGAANRCALRRNAGGCSPARRRSAMSSCAIYTIACRSGLTRAAMDAAGVGAGLFYRLAFAAPGLLLSLASARQYRNGAREWSPCRCTPTRRDEVARVIGAVRTAVN
jgi:dTDP-4-amino-4,6-dideoxygalactose transaminase